MVQIQPPDPRTGGRRFEETAAKAKAAYDAGRPPKPEAPAKPAPAPKAKTGPANAYSLYVKAQFPALKVKQPDAKLADIAKQISAMWKTADKKRHAAGLRGLCARRAPVRARALAAATRTRPLPRGLRGSQSTRLPRRAPRCPR